MKKRSITFALLNLITVAVFAQEPTDNFNVYFKQDFEHNTLGVYQEDEWYRDWNYPSWSNRQVPPVIMQNSDSENGTKVMRFNYPQGGVGPSQGGGQWNVTFDKPFEEVYFSYRIKFKPGFEWVLGGKIPGIMGGEMWEDPVPPWDHGFIGLLMWNDRPSVQFYYYHHDLKTDHGSVAFWNKPIESGKWYTITFRAVIPPCWL